ncbi:MAG: VCBS repeat-containing protein [Archangium sp.]|nr:VCBS repeat-containing protein [Archangium sp.]
MKRASLLLLIVVAGCRDGGIKMIDMNPPPPPPECGDSIIQDGEDCDGSDLGAATCQSLGFDTGRVICNAATCKYDTSLCVRRCGNGVLDLGESCDGKLGVMPCTTWGANVCTATCTIDTRFCVSPAFESGPDMDISKGGPAVVGDFAPKGPGDLLMAVPAFTRVELVPWSMTQGFDAVASRKLSFFRSPLRAEIVDVNGDTNLDVAQINADGALDFLVYNGSTYTLQTADAGCMGGTFLATDGVPRGDVTIAGCGGYVTVGSSTTRVTAPGFVAVGRAGPQEIWWVDAMPSVHFEDGGTATISSALTQLGGADFDGDGDLDLAGLTGMGVEIFENTGSGFASRVMINAAAPGDLHVTDLDGDGEADVFFTTGDDVVVRRNRGGFTFTETRFSGGTGARVSVSIGDVDGDQDRDVAVTVSTGGDTTRTRLIINRTR